MITWLITVKEIKQHVRDFRTLIFLLAFPVVLMLILGVTLTNTFNDQVKLDGMKVLVNDKSGTELSQSFAALEQRLRGMGIEFEGLKEGQNGRKEVENNRYTAYVEVTDDGMLQYGSSRNALESSIVQGILQTFTDKYNASVAVVREGGDPEEALRVFTDTDSNSDFIMEQSIKADRKPRAMDYFALSMTVMAGLWSALSTGGLVRGEIVRGTGIRLLSAPISRSQIYVGKVLGNVAVNTLCMLIIVLFSKWAFKAYWGNHLPVIFAVVIAEIIMATSFGIAVHERFKEGGVGLVLLVVQLASIFGGAYFPVENSGLIGLAAWLSPIKWGSEAASKIVYAGNVSAAWPVIGLYLGLAVLFLGTAVIIRRNKEEF